MCLRRTVFEMRGDGVQVSHDIRGTISWMNGECHNPLRGVSGVGEGAEFQQAVLGDLVGPQARFGEMGGDARDVDDVSHTTRVPVAGGGRRA